MALASIETLIADIRAGKMVILMDDEDRENEAILFWQALIAHLSTLTLWRGMHAD